MFSAVMTTVRPPLPLLFGAVEASEADLLCLPSSNGSRNRFANRCAIASMIRTRSGSYCDRSGGVISRSASARSSAANRPIEVLADWPLPAAAASSSSRSTPRSSRSCESRSASDAILERTRASLTSASSGSSGEVEEEEEEAKRRRWSETLRCLACQDR